MTKEQEAFESHLHLCKPQYKSTGVDELLTSYISFWYRLLLSYLVFIHFWYRSVLIKMHVSFRLAIVNTIQISRSYFIY